MVNQEPIEIDLLKFFEFLWSKKILIALIAFVCMFVSLIYSLMSEKQFTSTATILPINDTTILGGISERFSGFGLGADQLSFDQLMEILQSNTVVGRVYGRILKNPVYFKKFSSEDDTRPLNQQIEAFKQMTNFIRQKNFLIRVETTSNSPQMSSDISNGYLDELGGYLNDNGLNMNFRVLDLAVPPYKKSAPAIRKNVMTSGFFGLLVAVCGFFGKYYFQVSRVKQRKLLSNE